MPIDSTSDVAGACRRVAPVRSSTPTVPTRWAQPPGVGGRTVRRRGPVGRDTSSLGWSFGACLLPAAGADVRGGPAVRVRATGEGRDGLHQGHREHGADDEESRSNQRDRLPQGSASSRSRQVGGCSIATSSRSARAWSRVSSACARWLSTTNSSSFSPPRAVHLGLGNTPTSSPPRPVLPPSAAGLERAPRCRARSRPSLTTTLPRGRADDGAGGAERRRALPTTPRPRLGGSPDPVDVQASFVSSSVITSSMTGHPRRRRTAPRCWPKLTADPIAVPVGFPWEVSLVSPTTIPIQRPQCPSGGSEK